MVREIKKTILQSSFRFWLIKNASIWLENLKKNHCITLLPNITWYIYFIPKLKIECLKIYTFKLKNLTNHIHNIFVSSIKVWCNATVAYVDVFVLYWYVFGMIHTSHINEGLENPMHTYSKQCIMREPPGEQLTPLG